jgi:sterol desaturase/sphingolipid hydroxylase (fatty acid hydroxylase superfamily)
MSVAVVRAILRGGSANNPSTSYKRQQARISRRRLYPLTAFYTICAGVALILALRTAHPWVAIVFFLAGIPIWTLVEYMFHRFVLHGRFPEGKGFIRRFAHERLDPLHWEHHERPLDGMHISGELKDLLPLFGVAAPVSFLFPIYTLPVLLAAVVESYVVEEWTHHCIHFYNFRNPYFRYIKRYHLYHHTRQGMEMGYGITSGLWDSVFNTRYTQAVRQALFGRGET